MDDFLAILRDQQPPVTDDHERLAELAVEFARQQYEEVRQLHLNALRKAKTYDDLVDYFDAEIE